MTSYDVGIMLGLKGLRGGRRRRLGNGNLGAVLGGLLVGCWKPWARATSRRPTRMRCPSC